MNGTDLNDIRITTTLLAFIISALAFLFSVVVLIRNRNKNKAYLLLRPCPNPNCIRCELYKTAQDSANKRLPYVVKYLKEKNDGYKCNLERVINGVRDPSGARLSSAVNGQYPSVLFVPHLPVHAIATSLHNSMINQIFPTTGSYCDNLKKEYFNSQMTKDGWQTNNSGATDLTVNPNQLWQVLYLMNQGRWIKENVAMCPDTYGMVKKIPSIMEKCMFGNIFFSVIYPGTKIEEHCGPTNVRHRIHYPLVVTKEESFSTPILKVMNHSLSWSEGKAFVFDDSLVHSAEYPQNNKSQFRVVLVIDIWHPNLSKAEQELISALYPSMYEK